MKGRSGSTGVETTKILANKLKNPESQKGAQSFTATESFLRRQLRPARVTLTVAGLAIVLLLGTFLVSYGSKVYENWRERRLLYRATTLLQEGKLGKAAQMAQ